MYVRLFRPTFIVAFVSVLLLQFQCSEMQTTSMSNAAFVTNTGRQHHTMTTASYDRGNTHMTVHVSTSSALTPSMAGEDQSPSLANTTSSYDEGRWVTATESSHGLGNTNGTDQGTTAKNMASLMNDEVEVISYSATITIESIVTEFETNESVTGGQDEIFEFWQWEDIAWEWWTYLQTGSAILGVLGNTMVILVLYQKRASFSSTDILIGSLAVADLLTSIFLVPIPGVINVPATWLGEVYCKVVYTSRFIWISVSASVFTLTLISVERFIAVAYPFRFKRIFSRRHTNLVIVLVWFMALVMNSFAFFIFYVDSGAHTGAISFPTANGGQVVGIISFSLVLVNPTAVMIVTQALTVYKLHLDAKKFQNMDTVSNSLPAVRLLRAKKRVIKLLFVINVVFILCWAPNQSAYLAFNFGLLDPTYLYGPIDRALVVLAFCNSCANPFIYTIQHPQFRAALIGLFTKSSSSSTLKTPVFSKYVQEPS